MELSEKCNAVTEEQISIIELLTGFVYYERCINSNDSERMRDFECSFHGNLWLIPPSRSRVKEHMTLCTAQVELIFNMPKMFASLALLTGAGDLVVDCLRLSCIQVKLLLIQIL